MIICSVIHHLFLFEHPKSRFLPNEEGSVVVDFDSSWFVGDIARIITVDSNADSDQTVVLTVSAKIKEEIVVNPVLINIGELQSTDIAPLNISIKILNKAVGTPTLLSSETVQKISDKFANVKNIINTETSAIKILAVDSSSPSILLEQTNIGDKAATIKVKFAKDLPTGALRERITVWNTSSHLKELIIPVVGEIAGPLKLSTKYIEFGVVTKKDFAKRSFTLNTTYKNFQIQKIGVKYRNNEHYAIFNKKEPIAIAVKKIDSGFNIFLEMKLPNGFDFAFPSMNISGNIIIATNIEENKEITVPFFGMLKKE